ncbi:hypothetical protein GWI33_019596 [Rhynchophorus ferrugineus]|uniref:Uncharacterized protein n=1 Tax=Rhynchophorus ferrugineus TaxID=354439 RepID=A0A834HSC3_RHYFE|nr:hypothetical protein GWI33_019596 [Rhynchophorus ferrugineus]
MALFSAIFYLIILVYASDVVLSQSDLRSALAAIDRRQKELADYEEQQQYGYSPYDQPDDLAFIANNAEGKMYDKDYMDDEAYEPLSKRFTTSFRERLEEDKKKQMEEFAKNLINNLESSGMPGISDENYLRELWERYYGNDISNYGNGLTKRAYYYPTYGIENIGLRKRNRYYDSDLEEPVYSIHHHVPREDNPDDWINYLKERRYFMKPYSQAHRSYPNSKRFAIAKRSNSYHGEQKRSVKKQTDPKVEKDLTNIFGGEAKPTDNPSSSTTPKPEKTKKYQESTNKKIEKKDNPKKEINKEVFAPVAPQNKKPLQIKKKSIDWSDYFGLDRRKKSENNGLDKEWLLERYNKAVAVSTKKRNAELPLQSFRNHDSPTTTDKDESHKSEEQKINEMDAKLEKLEDEIVEDALKYTGAHQDDVDSKEVQQIKDNIISRLAQAYNIEKMRSALEEYKIEIEKARKEVEKNKGSDRLFDDYILEEKRLSVPRKEAIDTSRETAEGDNNIKCTSSEDCHEQNYRTPSDIIDNHFANLDQCPAIQRACNDVASIIGHYGHVFEAACNIHQMCLLCSNNSWFSPTRQCNILFLSKAYELCLGKEECKKEARRSVRYLLDINKSLQAQSALNDECELHCPDTDIISK